MCLINTLLPTMLLLYPFLAPVGLLLSTFCLLPTVFRPQPTSLASWPILEEDLA